MVDDFNVGSLSEFKLSTLFCYCFSFFFVFCCSLIPKRLLQASL